MFSPTPGLVKNLREDFSAEKCAQALINVMTVLMAAIGVRIHAKVIKVEKDAPVDSAAVVQSINDLTAVMSSIMAGSKIDVMKMWEGKNVAKPKT